MVLLVQVIMSIMGYVGPRSKLFQRLMYLIPLAGAVLAIADPWLGWFIITAEKVPGNFNYVVLTTPAGIALAALSSAVLLLMFVMGIIAIARKKTSFMDYRVIFTLLGSVLVPSVIKYIEGFIESLTGVNYQLSIFLYWVSVLTVCTVCFGYLRSARIMAVEKTGEAFIVFDKWGAVVDINQAGRQFFLQYGFISPPSRAQFGAMLGTQATGPLTDEEFTLGTGEETRYYRASNFSISDGISKYCGEGYIIREVTEYRRRMDELNTLAIEDALTGVKNRRYFYEAAPDVLRRAAVSGSELTLLMIDIDHFKSINDTHGHGVGDEVLKQMCSRCVSSLRKSDVMFRYGGEEFLILCEGTSQKDGEHMAARLLTAVGNTPFTTTAGNIPVTVSVGGCTFRPFQGDSIERWVDRADENMYTAKQTGRNRVYYAS